MKNVEVLGRHIKFDIPMNDKFDFVEMQLRSSRNNPLSRLSDVSSSNPHKEKEIEFTKQYSHDLFFPFIDVKPEKGLDLYICFERAVGKYCFNTGYCKYQTPIEKKIRIDSGELLAWENDIYVSDKTNRITDCYVSKKYFSVARRIIGRLQLLSDWFHGEIKFIGHRGNDEILLLSQVIEVESKRKETKSRETINQKSLSYDVIKESIQRLCNFEIRAWNRNSDELSGGGQYLFYDEDLHAYRANHWNWTWGPSIAFFLGILSSLDIPEKEMIEECAVSLGNTILKFQCPDGLDPYLSGVNLGRWQNSLSNPNCVIGYYSIADSGFCAKWGLAPLYRYTKDARYLDSMISLEKAATKWQETFGVIPSDYQEDKDSFTDRTLDETMFGIGLFSELYDLTKDTKYVDEGHAYFDSIVSALYLGDGRWSRVYMQKEKENLGFQNDTKGHGWAMDGLLCGYDLFHEQEYLTKACLTADFVTKYQNDDGSFTNYFASEETGGIGEKSTALWSWLLYRLYSVTNKAEYLFHARQALVYLLNNMDSGSSDPELDGAIVACSEQSGIIYRPYYHMACLYTTSFMGLAALEELKLQKRNQCKTL